MRKLIVSCVAIVICVSIAALIWFAISEKNVQIQISRQQLQDSIEKRFPLEKEAAGGILKIRLSDPKVALHDGSDIIEFACHVETNIKVNDRTLSGNGMIQGKIRYVPQAGEFRLDQSKIKIAVGGLSEKHNKVISILADKIAGDYLDGHPIYRLKDTNIKHQAAKLFLKSVVVKNGLMHITLGIN